MKNMDYIWGRSQIDRKNIDTPKFDFHFQSQLDLL